MQGLNNMGTLRVQGLNIKYHGDPARARVKQHEDPA